MSFNRATFEIPAPAPGHVRVPSFRVTSAELAEWGFPIRETEQMMGAMTILREGFTPTEAHHMAACAGFSFVAIEPFAEWEARRNAGRAAHAAEMAQRRVNAAESLAFFAAQREVCAAA